MAELISSASESPASALPRGDAGLARAAHGSLSAELGALARSGSLALAGQITSAILAFVFSLLVSHQFRAVSTGAFFEAIALFTVCSFIATMGADTGLTRSLPYLKVHGRSSDFMRVLLIAVAPPVFIASAMAVVLWIYAPTLADLVTNAPRFGAIHASGTETFTSYLRVIIPFLPLATVTAVLVAGARGFDSMWPAAGIQNTLVPLTRVVMLVGLVGLGVGTLAVGISWSLPLLLGALGCLVAVRALSQKRSNGDEVSPMPGAWRHLSREFWGYSAPRGLGSAFSFIVLWLDIVLVGALASTRQAGIYAVASRYVILATFPMVALGFAIAPQISRLFTSNRLREAGDVFKAATAWLVALAWPACLVMAVFSPVLMRLFGKEFVAGATSLTILSIAMLVNTGSGSCGVVLAMTGLTTANLVIAFSAATVDIAGNFVLIPHLGMRGAALAWAAAMLVANGSTLAVLMARFRLHPFGAATMRVGAFSVACFGAAGLVLRATMGPTWTALLIVLVVGLPVYLFLLWHSRMVLGLGDVRRVVGGPSGDAGPPIETVDYSQSAPVTL
jgi:O-antigen/teichoic acid export membrane protein